MDRALSFGTLPQIATLVTEKREDVARQLLASYVTTYLREEIQAEALTRNVGAFARFLQIAAQHHGQVIEFASISRDCAVPASTVKEYFQILEDTLIGFLLWPFDRSERKKSRPRFYLFDCGVIRALQQRLEDPPTPAETGFLFENWVVNELRRIRDYERKPHEFAFWRERDRVVDLLVTKGNRVIHAFKCKSGRTDLRPGVAGRFREIFPGVPLAVISMSDARPRMADGVEILPVKEALQRYRAL